MTNEQLAVLLKNVAGRVRALAAEIEPTITDGQYETRRVWIGPQKAVMGIEDMLEWHASLQAGGSNWREERGRPLACAMIEALADELDEQAESLAQGEPDGASHAVDVP